MHKKTKQNKTQKLYYPRIMRALSLEGETNSSIRGDNIGIRQDSKVQRNYNSLTNHYIENNISTQQFRIPTSLP